MKRRISGGEIAVDERDGIVQARGVRYGRAARFDAAVPEPPWSDVVDQTRSGPVCPQRPGRLNFVTGAVLDDLVVDEDCLVLSVTAPAVAGGLPVMVWFHGGAYVAGSGESAKYDPTRLVREGNVVVVNVSYRLGIFGYLAPPDADADDNLGLRDQILALRWVQQNIGAFGGDPSNVTAFGQSAGADSVLALMLSDEAAGLFRRAIVQSAPLGVGTGDADLVAGRTQMASVMQQAMATALAGVPPREASPAQLLAAEGAAVQAAQRFGVIGGMAFAPIMGRQPLPAAGRIAARMADAASRVELLIGHTKHDAAPFVAMNARVAALGRVKTIQRLAIRAAAPTVTGRMFGVDGFVESWQAHGGRVRNYRFDWEPQQAPLGSCHCMELPFLFGATDAWADAPMLGPMRSIDQDLAVHLRSVWSRFAHYGTESISTPSIRFA